MKVCKLIRAGPPEGTGWGWWGSNRPDAPPDSDEQCVLAVASGARQGNIWDGISNLLGLRPHLRDGAGVAGMLFDAIDHADANDATEEDLLIIWAAGQILGVEVILGD